MRAEIKRIHPNLMRDGDKTPSKPEMAMIYASRVKERICFCCPTLDKMFRAVLTWACGRWNRKVKRHTIFSAVELSDVRFGRNEDFPGISSLRDKPLIVHLGGGDIYNKQIEETLVTVTQQGIVSNYPVVFWYIGTKQSLMVEYSRIYDYLQKNDYCIADLGIAEKWCQIKGIDPMNPPPPPFIRNPEESYQEEKKEEHPKEKMSFNIRTPEGLQAFCDEIRRRQQIRTEENQPEEASFRQNYNFEKANEECVKNNDMSDVDEKPASCQPDSIETPDEDYSTQNVFIKTQSSTTEEATAVSNTESSYEEDSDIDSIKIDLSSLENSVSVPTTESNQNNPSDITSSEPYVVLESGTDSEAKTGISSGRLAKQDDEKNVISPNGANHTAYTEKDLRQDETTEREPQLDSLGKNTVKQTTESVRLDLFEHVNPLHFNVTITSGLKKQPTSSKKTTDSAEIASWPKDFEISSDLDAPPVSCDYLGNKQHTIHSPSPPKESTHFPIPTCLPNMQMSSVNFYKTDTGIDDSDPWPDEIQFYDVGRKIFKPFPRGDTLSKEIESFTNSMEDYLKRSLSSLRLSVEEILRLWRCYCLGLEEFNKNKKKLEQLGYSSYEDVLFAAMNELCCDMSVDEFFHGKSGWMCLLKRPKKE